MASPAPFEPVLSGKALAFLSTLSKRRKRRLVDLIFRLSDYPHQPGDYDSVDELGRRVQHLQTGDLAVPLTPVTGTADGGFALAHSKIELIGQPSGAGFSVVRIR